jgi:hypothetical protein
MWFCIETAYTRASTLLSWVALWALGFVRASVRARTGGCGSGSSLTQEILTDFLEPIGALGIMVADSESKTGHLKVTHSYARYSSRAGHANIGRGQLSVSKGKWMAPMPPRWRLIGISWA